MKPCKQTDLPIIRSQGLSVSGGPPCQLARTDQVCKLQVRKIGPLITFLVPNIATEGAEARLAAPPKHMAKDTKQIVQLNLMSKQAF